MPLLLRRLRAVCCWLRPAVLVLQSSARVASSAFLQQDIAYLKGIGPARAKVLLSELGIRTVRDLLYTFPYKYVDRTVVHTVSQVHEGMPYVQLKGRIIGYELEGQGRKQQSDRNHSK